MLMGGTLPVMVRALDADEANVAWNGGLLYAANTAGAIAGAIVTPFVLIPALGMRGTAMAAASLNLAAAVTALVVSARRLETVDRRPDGDRRFHADRRPKTADRSVAVRLYAIAGGVALGYEVVWSQMIVQFISTRVFAFAIVLATYLAGLAIGSAIYARVGRRIGHPWTAFGLLVAAASLVALIEVAAFGPWLLSLQSDAEELLRTATGNELAAMCGRFVVAVVGVVLRADAPSRSGFPAVLRLDVCGTIGPGTGACSAGIRLAVSRARWWPASS